MIRNLLLSASLVAAVATFTVVGCGGSSNNNPGGGAGSDSGTGGPTGGDSGGVTPGSEGGTTPNDGGGATGNPPLPDGSIYPHGTQLVPNNVNLVLNGVTSDDYAVYTDETSSTAFVAYAISLAAGSKPISLGPVDSNDDVSVIGKVVFLGTSADQNGVGAASVWTSSAAAPASISTATLQGFFGVSSDGSHVIFLDGIPAAEATASIASAASDGTGKATLVGSVDIADNFCFPQIGFGGTYAVAAYCEVGDAGGVDAGTADGGTNLNVGTVTSYAGASAASSALIAANVQTVFSVDATGTTVVVNGATGTVAYPIAGGGAVPIDATGQVGQVTFTPGLLTSDGSHLVYTTTANALERAATTSPADPVQLAAAGTFADVFRLSPDGNWVVGTLTWSQKNGGEGNLFLAATASDGGAPATLSSAATSGLEGDVFTTDSSHVLFYTGLGQSGGTLSAATVGGGTPATIGTNAITDLATSGAKIVFNSNYDATTGGADLQSVDTSTTTAPAVLVTAADQEFFLNAEKTAIVYVWSYEPGSSSGLWTLPVP
jgi:hypothetical protein